MNQESRSPPTVKRKRGRPRKDEGQTQQEKSPITPASINGTADDMMGQVVSGVVEGSFDAGYFLNVKVADTDKQLRGVVFIPEKVTPITAENDVAPHVKMYEREQICAPSSNPRRTHPRGQESCEKQTDNNIVHEFQTGIGSEKTVIPSVMLVKDIDDASLLEKVPPQETTADYGPENQALSLMLQSCNEQHHDGVPAGASKKSSTGRDSITEGNPLVDFFPASEATRLQSQNLELFNREAKLSTRDEPLRESPSDGEPRGFNLMTEKRDSAMENVPEEELQLELGSKIMSSVKPPHHNGGLGLRKDIASDTDEANAQRASSMSGFLANLFEGEDAGAEPDPAARGSALGLGSAAGEGGSSATCRNVDCNRTEATPQEQPKNPLVSD